MRNNVESSDERTHELLILILGELRARPRPAEPSPGPDPAPAVDEPISSWVLSRKPWSLSHVEPQRCSPTKFVLHFKREAESQAIVITEAELHRIAACCPPRR